MMMIGQNLRTFSKLCDAVAALAPPWNELCGVFGRGNIEFSAPVGIEIQVAIEELAGPDLAITAPIIEFSARLGMEAKVLNEELTAPTGVREETNLRVPAGSNVKSLHSSLLWIETDVLKGEFTAPTRAREETNVRQLAGGPDIEMTAPIIEFVAPFGVEIEVVTTICS